jgi:hypothetical protein
MCSPVVLRPCTSPTSFDIPPAVNCFRNILRDFSSLDDEGLNPFYTDDHLLLPLETIREYETVILHELRSSCVMSDEQRKQWARMMALLFDAGCTRLFAWMLGVDQEGGVVHALKKASTPLQWDTYWIPVKGSFVLALNKEGYVEKVWEALRDKGCDFTLRNDTGNKLIHFLSDSQSEMLRRVAPEAFGFDLRGELRGAARSPHADVVVTQTTLLHAAYSACGIQSPSNILPSLTPGSPKSYAFSGLCMDDIPLLCTSMERALQKHGFCQTAEVCSDYTDAVVFERRVVREEPASLNGCFDGFSGGHFVGVNYIPGSPAKCIVANRGLGRPSSSKGLCSYVVIDEMAFRTALPLLAEPNGFLKVFMTPGLYGLEYDPSGDFSETLARKAQNVANCASASLKASVLLHMREENASRSEPERLTEEALLESYHAVVREYRMDFVSRLRAEKEAPVMLDQNESFLRNRAVFLEDLKRAWEAKRATKPSTPRLVPQMLEDLSGAYDEAQERVAEVERRSPLPRFYGGAQAFAPKPLLQRGVSAQLPVLWTLPVKCVDFILAQGMPIEELGACHVLLEAFLNSIPEEHARHCVLVALKVTEDPADLEGLANRLCVVRNFLRTVGWQPGSGVFDHTQNTLLQTLVFILQKMP